MKESQLNLRKFIRVSRQECKDLDIKKGSYIYLLVDIDDIVYVGQTNKPNDRLYTHSKSYRKFTHIYLKNVNPNLLIFFESHLIFHLMPIYNSTIPNNIRYVSFDKLYKEYLSYKELTIRFIGRIPYVDSKKHLIIRLNPFIETYYSSNKVCSSIEKHNEEEFRRLNRIKKHKK